MVLAVNTCFDLHLVGAAAGSIGLGIFRLSGTERIDNITDWALGQFVDRYGEAVTKDAIFHYVYGVLHDPLYRETYAQNLKREFPRIPFYDDFEVWRGWGEALMALHLHYETVEPWPLQRVDTAGGGAAPRVILKSNVEAGVIVLDGETQLSSVPRQAWDYVLGNRSAIDWVLDQHKEKKIRDPTVREKFNTYRFADHKERRRPARPRRAGECRYGRDRRADARGAGGGARREVWLRRRSRNEPKRAILPPWPPGATLTPAAAHSPHRRGVTPRPGRLWARLGCRS